MKIEGSGSISKRHGFADPDPNPHQNAMDPELWPQLLCSVFRILIHRGARWPSSRPLCRNVAVLKVGWPRIISGRESGFELL
jgi:hypothetical protein